MAVEGKGKGDKEKDKNGNLLVQADQESSSQKQGDVFDKQGNEGMKAHMNAFVASSAEGVDESNSALRAAMDQFGKEKRKGNEVTPEEFIAKKGVDAREELIMNLERMVTQIDELQMLETLDNTQRAIQVMEYIAENMTDRELDELAMYDHGDLREKMVVTFQAEQITNELSPQGLKLRAFAPLLYQMVFDAFENSGLGAVKKKREEEEGLEQGKPRQRAADVGAALMPMLSFLRLMGQNG